jgi:hypothetical protein
MSRSGALNAGPAGLADLVRLWAQALQADPTCERPQPEWCRLLEVPGFDGVQAESLLLPPQPELFDLPEPDVSPDPLDLESLHVADIPLAQPPRLQAPVLAVVAADFEPEPDSEAEAEVLHGLSDLTDEDYQPLAPSQSAPWLPLAPLTRWWPALRRFTPLREAGPDLSRLVREFARCRPARRLPRLRRRGRYRRLLVIRDWRKCMIPFERDFEQLIGCLHMQQQAEALVEAVCHGFPPAIPSNVDAVLVLSDLGLCASSEPVATAELWAAWARALRVRGVAVEAWVPASARGIPADLAKAMHCVPWHERSRFRPTSGQRGALQSCSAERDVWMDRLWPLLAIAQRIEPALLRRARLLAGGDGQPEWEAGLWDSSEQHAAGEGVLQLRPSQAPRWRERFAQLPPAVQQQVWQMFHAQHAHLPCSTLMLERLVWGAHVDLYAHESAHRDAVDRAKAWLLRMSAQEARQCANARGVARFGEDRALHSGFLHGLVQRNAADAKFTKTYAESYVQLATAVGRMGEGEGIHLEEWAGILRQTRKTEISPWSILLHHSHDGLLFEKWSCPADVQAPFALTHTRTLVPLAERALEAIWQPIGRPPQMLGLLHRAEEGVLCFSDVHGAHRLSVGILKRADWQDVLGQDHYGVFCDLRLIGRSDVMRLRFRYIPPGTFIQGSSIGYRFEFPQHPVTLTQGFWMAEIPCTLELWVNVVKDIPRRQFGGLGNANPVVNVSWSDVFEFLENFGRLLPPGCVADLPTESEWEYACRAGTETRYWWGNTPGDGRANWEGERTTPVKYYPPNPWGLYDMHGNVWEWCKDGKRNYLGRHERDPEGVGTNDHPVARGGSWMNPPGHSRSAYRSARHRDFTFPSQGFRIILRDASIVFSRNLKVFGEELVPEI